MLGDSVDFQRVLVIGASQRAAVNSILASNRVPICWDFFADWDTCKLVELANRRLTQECRADVVRLDSYRDVLDRDISNVADCVLLSGGCELVSDVVDHVAKQLPIVGCQPDGLRQFADMAAVLASINTFIPAVSVPWMSDDLGVAAERSRKNGASMLLKPRSGCGGHRIRLLNDAQQPQVFPLGTANKRLSSEFYVQQFEPGDSFSALFSTCHPGRPSPAIGPLANDRDRRASNGAPTETASTELLGVTRQLVGERWLHAKQFSYCGSIGPLRWGEPGQRNHRKRGWLDRLQRLGRELALRFDLRGIWGLDFLLSPAMYLDRDSVDPAMVVLDINPRIPASAELYEAGVRIGQPHPGRGSEGGVCAAQVTASPRSLFDWHVRGTEGLETGALRQQIDRLQNPSYIEGKAVLFHRADAKEPVQIVAAAFEKLVERFDQRFYSSEESGRTLADIPVPGQSIKPGGPILTVRTRVALNGQTSERSDHWVTSMVRRELQQEIAIVEGMLGLSPPPLA